MTVIDGDASVAIDDAPTVPTSASLAASYPNPFARTTTLGFEIAEAGIARLVVYDVLGREVAVLMDGPVAVGRHEAVFDAAGLPSGTYVVRLRAGSFVATQRVTVVR